MKSPNSKNTLNWQRSIEKRKELIEKAESLNIKLHNPHNMKLWQIESLVNNHKMVVEADKSNAAKVGEYLTYAEIARLAEMSPQLLYYRLKKQDMTLEETLTKPIVERERRTELTAEQVEIAHSNGITRKMVTSRRGLGWSMHEAITYEKGTIRKMRSDFVEDEKPVESRATRKSKQAERMRLLQEIESLEDSGGCAVEIRRLEKVLVNI